MQQRLYKQADLKSFTDQVKDYESKFLPEGQIIDGLFNPEEYFQSPIKIAWMLKEAYTKDKATWHISTLYNNEDPYNHFFKESPRRTWHPVIYASYSVLKGFPEWQNMDYIRDDHSMCDIVRKIAVINANKWASKTGTQTLYHNLVEGFNASWDITELQLQVLKPDVMIFGSTFFLYKEKFLLDREKHFFGRHGAFEVWELNGQLLIDAKHPGQMTISQKEYFDSIVDAIKSKFGHI